jgi:3-hydroxyacyl-[acyl-carrier-protein] dehydratase
MVDIEQIRDVIPHRYPFLLVDRIAEIDENGTRCVGIKNISANERVVQSLMPDQMIFPGALLVEHMAQVGCYLLLSKPDARGKLAYFAAIDEVEFRKPVAPGDTVVTTVELITGRRGIWRIKAVSRVGDEVVCSGILTSALVDY